MNEAESGARKAQKTLSTRQLGVGKQQLASEPECTSGEGRHWHWLEQRNIQHRTSLTLFPPVRWARSLPSLPFHLPVVRWIGRPSQGVAAQTRLVCVVPTLPLPPLSCLCVSSAESNRSPAGVLAAICSDWAHLCPSRAVTFVVVVGRRTIPSRQLRLGVVAKTIRNHRPFLPRHDSGNSLYSSSVSPLRRSSVPKPLLTFEGNSPELRVLNRARLACRRMLERKNNPETLFSCRFP